MRKTESKEIDGLTFEVTQLEPRKAERLLLKVLGLLSGSIGKTIASLAGSMQEGKSLGDADINFSQLAEAVPELFKRLTPDEFEAIQKELLATCFVTVDGRKMQLLPAYDLVLAGHSFAVGFQLAWFAFTVNYGDFSAALTERFATTLARARASRESITSVTNGRSGAS